jgi:tetratricopeptide (TPR) repeat protein
MVKRRALHQLGAIAVAQGNLDQATQLLLEAETDYREAGSWIDIAYCRNDLGYIRLSQGNVDEAMTLFEDAWQLPASAGIRLPSHSCRSAWAMRIPHRGTPRLR